MGGQDPFRRLATSTPLGHVYFSLQQQCEGRTRRVGALQRELEACDANIAQIKVEYAAKSRELGKQFQEKGRAVLGKQLIAGRLSESEAWALIQAIEIDITAMIEPLLDSCGIEMAAVYARKEEIMSELDEVVVGDVRRARAIARLSWMLHS